MEREVEHTGEGVESGRAPTHTSPDLVAFRRALEERVSSSPLLSWLGVAVQSVSRGEVVLALEIKPHHLNLQGILHGGVTATLLDTAMGMALRSASQRRFRTVQMSLSYLRPASEGRVLAHGRAVFLGRSLAHAEAELTEAAGRQIARATGTFALVREEGVK